MKELSSSQEKEFLKTRRDFSCKHPKNVFLVHLNVDFLQNKFESVNKLIKDTLD